jgi:hypothetical protein
MVLVGMVLIAAFVDNPAGELELTPAAKASPLANRWLTFDRDFLTGDLRQGDKPVEGEWSRVFEAVPEALPHARRGQALRARAFDEFFAGAGLAGSSLVSLLVLGLAFKTFTIALAVSLPLFAAFVVAEVLCAVHLRQAREATYQAIRLYNSALNEALPPDQRLDLGEFGFGF